MKTYDLVVIGAGSGARDAANKAKRDYGASVALVERERWGGSCPNVACTPTKAYLVAAGLTHEINTLAAKLGIEVGPARVDLRRVKARKEALKKPQAKWVEDLRAAGFDTYDGTATLVDRRTVRVGGEDLRAERVLLATGSRTAVPPIDGIDRIDWLDHVSALELEELPGSLLVVGGGPVGLELAQAFSRFGSRVTLVQSAGRIAPRSDPGSARALEAALREEGIEILLSTSVTRLANDDGEVVATVGERELRVERLLLASGRVPNVEQLGLEAVGVETSRAGVVVDGRMRTSVEGIWAIGDVNGQAPFTPVAQYQARIAVDDMFRPGAASPADYSALPTAIFTHPELAAVGLTAAEARGRGHDAEEVVHPLSAVRRASYTDERHGHFKVVFDRRTRRVLGVHVVAPEASEVVQWLAVSLKLGVSVDDLAGAHHVFPTIGEGVKAAAEQARI